MARIRSIHYDALKSEKLAASSAEAERLYWRLATHCDDAGRAEDDPRLFAAYLFPLNDEITGPVVSGWLAELDRTGLIVRYEVDGRRFLAVTKWDEYQKPNRPTPSKFPAPPMSIHGALTEDSLTAHGALTTGVEGSGEGKGEGEARKRAITPTQSFAISDRFRAWAKENTPGIDLDRERGAWIDWAQANGKSFKDLDAGFRTWCRRAQEWRGEPVKESGPARAILGRGPDAPPTWVLDDEGNAIKPPAGRSPVGDEREIA